MIQITCLLLTIVGHLVASQLVGGNNCYYADSTVREDYTIVECAIFEEQDAPRTIGTLNQKVLIDALRLPNANVSFRLNTLSHSDKTHALFELNEQSGNLTALRRVDREELELERLCSRDARSTRNSYFANYQNISCSLRLTAYVLATRNVHTAPSPNQPSPSVSKPARESLNQADTGKQVQPASNRAGNQQRRIEITIRLHILDVNDEEPRWPNGHLTAVSFAENEPSESTRYLEAAIDRDAGANSQLRYRLVPPVYPPKPNVTFNCAQTGIVSVMLHGGTHLPIDVMTQCQLMVDEMRVDTVSGRPFIRLRRTLDRESIAAQFLVAFLEATDGGSPTRSATLTIVVDVVDVNDNPPQFERNAFNVTVAESGVMGSLVTVRANDADRTEANNQLAYTIAHVESARFGSSLQPLANGAPMPFAIDDAGNVELVSTLDYETAAMYTLVVIATDSGTPPRSASAFVNVYVTDVNDNEPRLNMLMQSGNLVENSENRGWFVTLEATDDDMQNEVTCRLTADRESAQFRLMRVELGGSSFTTSRLYRLSVRPGVTFDRESSEVATPTIICEDSGRPVHPVSFPFSFNIADVNDNAPRFATTQHHFSIPEGDYTTRSRFIGQLIISDEDTAESSTQSFSIVGEPFVSDCFRIDERGELFARCELDRETRASYQFEALVVDSSPSEDGSTQRFSATTSISVVVSDVNDCTPQILTESASSGVEFVMDEGAPLQTVIGQLRALDCDAPGSPNSDIHYALDAYDADPDAEHETLPFHVETNGTIWLRRTVDREQLAQYTFAVRASDNGEPHPLSATVRVTVNLRDANDNAPNFVHPTPSSPAGSLFFVRCDAPTSHRVARVRATDRDAGQNGHLRYVLLQATSEHDPDSPFSLDSSSGELYVSRAMQCDATPADASYLLRIAAIDGGVPALNATMELRVAVGGYLEAPGPAKSAPSSKTHNNVQPRDDSNRQAQPGSRQTPPSSNRNTNANNPAKRAASGSNSSGDNFYEALNRVIVFIIIAVLCVFAVLVVSLCVIIMRRRRLARRRIVQSQEKAKNRTKAAVRGEPKERNVDESNPDANNNGDDCARDASASHSEAEEGADPDADECASDVYAERECAESAGRGSAHGGNVKDALQNASAQSQAGCAFRTSFDAAHGQQHPCETATNLQRPSSTHARLAEQAHLRHTLNGAYYARSVNDSLNGVNVNVAAYRPIAMGGAQKYHFAANTLCESSHLVVSPVPVVPRSMNTPTKAPMGAASRSGSVTFTHSRPTAADYV